MKLRHKLQPWLPSLVAGIALSSASVCMAASTIVLDTFDSSSISSWGANGSTLQWVGTEDAGGTANKGALMVAYTNNLAGGWQAAQPQRNLGSQAFNSSNYWSITFDIRVDANSSPGADAPFGHVQIIPIDSTGTWLPGIGWTALTEESTTWQHVEVSLLPPYADLSALAFQVGDSGFSGDVIFYLDNIKVTPIPAEFIFTQFSKSTDADGWTWATWSQPGASSWVSTPDAGGAATTGALELDANFNDPGTAYVYQQVVFQKNFDMDPNRFTYMDLDVKMDPSSYPMSDGNYPNFETILNINGNWGWASLGNPQLEISNTNWTHLSYPLAGKGATNMHAITLKTGAGWDGHFGPTNTLKLFVDNIRFWTPQISPTVSVAPSGPSGLEIVATAPTDAYQRQNIVTPANSYNYSWVNMGAPVTYSFTLTSFPDAVKNPGFEAHMYLINYDTLPESKSWNELYSAVDWNAADLINAKVVNNANGGVDFSFTFKTNRPGDGIDQNVAAIHADSAIGTWSLTFNDNTSVTLTTPSGSTTNFSIATDVADKFYGQMFLDFGIFKGGLANTGQKATFSRIQVAGGGSPFDETFPGPGLNPDPANPAWRLAADAAGLIWVPQDTAWWLTWSLPDTGFRPQLSSTVVGGWTDVNLNYIVEGATSRSAAVPKALLPAGNSTFFRMVKPQ